MIEPNCRALGIVPVCVECELGYECWISFYKRRFAKFILEGEAVRYMKGRYTHDLFSKTLELYFPEYLPKLNAIILLK